MLTPLVPDLRPLQRLAHVDGQPVRSTSVRAPQRAAGHSLPAGTSQEGTGPKRIDLFALQRMTKSSVYQLSAMVGRLLARVAPKSLSSQMALLTDGAKTDAGPSPGLASSRRNWMVTYTTGNGLSIGTSTVTGSASSSVAWTASRTLIFCGRMMMMSNFPWKRPRGRTL